MDRLRRFEGKKIIVDGIEGTIVHGGRGGGGSHFFPDNHCRFVFYDKDDQRPEQFTGRVVSGGNLLPDDGDNGHGLRRLVIADEIYMTIYQGVERFLPERVEKDGEVVTLHRNAYQLCIEMIQRAGL